MTLGAMILLVLFITVVGVVAYWIIKKFFEPPVQMVALAITGVILLFILLSQLAPEMLGMRIWRW